MNTYTIRIRENATGEIREGSPPGCGWTEYSADPWRKMCDCNLHGFFGRMRQNKDGAWELNGPHDMVAGQLSKSCKHDQPSKRYTAVEARLRFGETIALSEAPIYERDVNA